MKTVVVYASKKGYVKEVAEKIREGLDGNADLVDIFSKKNLNLSSYDLIVLASSVKAGSFYRKFKKLCEQQIPLLKDRKVVLLVAGLNEEGYEAAAAQNLSEESRHLLWKTVYAGGRYLPEQYNGLIRGIMEKINKGSGPVLREKWENVEALVQDIRAL